MLRGIALTFILTLALPIGCSSSEEEGGAACDEVSDCWPEDPTEDATCTCNGGSKPVCVRLSAAGEACESSLECAFDGLCVTLGDGDRRCSPRGAVGEQCDETAKPCARDLYCDEGTCVTGYRREGEECEHDRHCVFGLYCDLGLTSELGVGLCAALAKPKFPCVHSSWGGQTCTQGNYCDGTGTCQPQKADLESCVSDDECRSRDCFYGQCTRHESVSCR